MNKIGKKLVSMLIIITLTLTSIVTVNATNQEQPEELTCVSFDPPSVTPPVYSIEINKWVKSSNYWCDNKWVNSDNHWVESAQVNLNDIVLFKGIVENPEENGDHKIDFSGVIYDVFPSNLEYIANSCTLLDLSQEVFETIDYINNTVYWYRIPILNQSENHTFYFNAKAISCGNGTNVLNTSAYVLLNRTVKIPVNDSDTASVYVNCDEGPQIFIEKLVWNGSGWSDYSEVSKYDNVSFKVMVCNPNDEGIISWSGWIYDLFPSFLKYVSGSINISWGDVYINVAESEDLFNNSVVWEEGLPDLAPGECLSLFYNATAIDCGTGNNTVGTVARIMYKGQSYFLNSTDNASVYVNCTQPETPGVSVVKTVSVDCQGEYYDNVTIDKDEWVTFRIVVTNTGDTPLNISVKDTLPSGLTYDDDASPEVSYINGNEYYWNFSNVPSQDSRTIYFRAIGSECGEFNNTVLVTAVHDCQTVYASDYAIVVVNCPPPEEPKLSVIKTVWNNTICDWAEHADVSLYDTVDFRVEIYNPNDFALRWSGWINDIFPDNLVYINGSLNVENDDNEWTEAVFGNEVRWMNMSDIPAFGYLNFTFKATAIKECTYGINTVYVIAHSTIDEKFVNGSDTASVFVDCIDEPNISIEKSVKFNCNGTYMEIVDAKIGDFVTFKLYINNTGDTTLNITIIDTLPLGLIFGGVTTPGYYPNFVSQDERTLIWDLYYIQPKTSIEINFSAWVIAGCGELVNNVNVTGKYDTQTVYDEDTATVIVTAFAPEIYVQKDVSIDGGCSWEDEVDTNYGTDVKFRIIVKNIGNSDLFNVYVNDTLPLGLEYNNSATVNGNNCEPTPAGDIFYWLFENLSINTTKEIKFNAFVVGEPCNGYENWAKATGENYCGVVDEEDDNAVVNVLCPPENPGVSVNKTVSVDCQGEYYDNVSIDKDEWVTFRIVVDNIGDVPLFISVLDALPAGLTYKGNANYPLDFIDEVNGYYYWNFTTPLGPDDPPIEITFEAYGYGCGENINSVNVTGVHNSQTVFADDTAIVIVNCPPPQVADVTVDKKVRLFNCGSYENEIVIQNNQWVTFRIIVDNTGETTLDFISVRDELPLGLTYRPDSANYTPHIFNGYYYWNFSNIAPEDDPIEITFSANGTGCGNNVNWVNVTGVYDSQTVFADDYAIVNIECDNSKIDVEKTVSKNGCDYSESVEITIGDLVTFKIVVINTGEIPLNIIVLDIIPKGLNYNGVSSDVPVVFENNLTWNIDLEPQTQKIITFQAKAIDEGDYKNIVNVTGTYEDRTVFDEDDAAVKIVCSSNGKSLEIIFNKMNIGKVKAVIKNINTTADLNDVAWSITIKGGLLGRINSITEGSIDSIDNNGGNEQIKSKSILGFGKVEVKVKAVAQGIDSLEISRPGFLLGMILIVSSP